MRNQRLVLILGTTLCATTLLLGWPAYCISQELLPRRIATAGADGSSFNITIDVVSRWNGFAARRGVAIIRSHDSTTGRLLSAVTLDMRGPPSSVAANIRLVSTNALCVVFAQGVAITSDGGVTWNTWVADTVRMPTGELHSAVVAAATVNASGIGSAELASVSDPRTVVARLATSDFGKTWTPSPHP